VFGQVELAWRAPPGCPQESEVRERLRDLSGPLNQRELQAEAEVEREGDRFRLRLRVKDGAEVRERVIVSNSCSDLAGAAAVALVFLLREAEDSREPGSTPAQQETPGEGHTGEQTGAKAPGTESNADEGSVSGENAASAPWALLIQAPVVGVDFGPLPKPSPTFGLGAGVRFDAWRLILRGALSPSQSVAADLPGAAAKVQRASGTLAACRAWPSGRLEFSPCLALGVERVSARGVGSDVTSRSDSVFWLAPGAEFALHVHLWDWLALFSGISGRFEASRPRIVIQELGELDKLGPFAVGVFIGAEWIP
jgi:hypothetical protein